MWSKDMNGHSDAPAKPIVVLSCISHPGLSLQLPTIVMEMEPMTKLQLICDPAMQSSYAGRTMCEHICAEFPALCPSLLPVSTEFCAQHSIGTDVHEARPAGVDDVDLLVCEWYPQCLRMLHTFGHLTPIISYYAGAPWNSYALRAGQETAAQHFSGLHELYAADITQTVNGAHTLVLADGPLTAETIRSFTGVPVPYAPPLSLYLQPRYGPTRRSLLLLKVQTTAGLLQPYLLLGLAKLFGQQRQLPYTLEAPGYVPWKELVRYAAVAFFPHGWMSMTFHELYATNTPLFIPARDWLISAVMLQQFDIRCRDLLNRPRDEWAPSHEGTKLHPWSPMILGPDYAPREKLAAALYWGRISELLYYPHVVRFHSVPDLLEKASAADLPAASRNMALVNRKLLLEAARFWPQALAALLGNRQ